MKNIEYNYLDINVVDSKHFNKLIPNHLDFSCSDKLINDKSSVCIGSTDDGWSSIYHINGKYYHVQHGLQEHEGHTYVTPVEITDSKQLTISKLIVKVAANKADKQATERRMLICAIRGSSPSYDLFDAFTTLKLGSYVGGFTDTWKWNHADSFKDITIEELRLMWGDLDMCWDKYGLNK